ncbi:copper radical oxidase [Crepidotus variabilis]|uniref:Copper radical oxidase n=1 Tax=Crepidotus variabilis TaxID=179855 RepID=A0A9P6JWY5_9AGAR|nr:copper radical oxidase [Crepidotus variabilis]
MISPLAFAGLSLASSFISTYAATPNTFENAGNTLVSAMMMFVGNEDSVYILDKAEANAAQVAGHSAWGAIWDLKSRKSQVMDIKTNSFCAAGMHLPNGSFASFGGNDAVTTGGATGSDKNTDGQTGSWDKLYQDFDGRKSIRIVNPCKYTDNLSGGACGWYDDPSVLSMKKFRWYSTVEPTATGEIVIMGGMVTGGYINRHVPNTDPRLEGGQAEPSYEYYPSRPADPADFQFIINTSGLNAYPHAFLMPSGKIFVQANLSTVLWDHEANIETPLPDMPKGVIRVYPASGGVAMLPMTPANNYSSTIIFCGGTDIPEPQWGDYVGPNGNPWEHPASTDCQRITPEPQDNSAPVYVQDDDMPDGRTMGQIILLPDGKLLMVNGGAKGTAAYASSTPLTPQANMPFGTSLCTDEVLHPALYDPNAPAGSRWSKDNLGSTTIPRLYHSTALLLPDASVLIAGSNPNPDVNIDPATRYKTEYRAEVYYPPYFNASTRPNPQNIPSTLSYGGNYFDILLNKDSYTGTANDAADATKVVILRSGFTTHAMNMGQRLMQLNNTYTVSTNGSITLHVSQPVPNANLFQPGPAFLHVVINGIPSNGKYVIVGTGSVGVQPTVSQQALPDNVRADTSSSTGSPSSGGSTASTNGESKKPSTALIVGSSIAAVAILAIAAMAAVLLRKRRRQASLRGAKSAPYAMEELVPPPMFGHRMRDSQASESTLITPLNPQDKTKGVYGNSDPWDASTTDLQAPYQPYRDNEAGTSRSGSPASFNPYAELERRGH